MVVVIMIFGLGKVIVPIVERYGLVTNNTSSSSSTMPSMEL